MRKQFFRCSLIPDSPNKEKLHTFEKLVKDQFFQLNKVQIIFDLDYGIGETML